MLMWLYIPLDFADEIEDDTLFWYAEDFGVDILGVVVTKYVIAFAVSVVVRIVGDFDQTIVAHAA